MIKSLPTRTKTSLISRASPLWTIGEPRSTASPLPSPDAATATSDVKPTKDLAWKVARPNAIFPWVHNAQLPEWMQQGQKFGPHIPPLNRLGSAVMIHATASNNLNIPWYELPFSQWKQDLADSSAWAFTQAVAGVLSHTYNVPMEHIAKEDTEFDVDFQHTTTATGSTPRKIDETKNTLDGMLEESFQNLYQHAHEAGRHNLQITLQTKPVGAHFISCFWIPYLSRPQVKAKPALKRAFINIRNTVQMELEKLGNAASTLETMSLTMRELDKFSARQTKDYEDYSSVESTVILLVLVECDEIFSVVDLETSKVIQGHEDHKIRRVNHVVRLEQVVNWIMHDTDGFSVKNGSWQITDWDDLLDGNIFYLGN